jgi:hypothetical protein
MLSKLEMETIWREQPYGAFKSIKSRMKGRKKFTISVEPYVKNFLPAQSFVVYAKNYNHACDEASIQFWAKNRDTIEVKIDGYSFKEVR